MNFQKILCFIGLISLWAQPAQARMPEWSYDPGPDPKTKMGKELIDLVAEIPNMPEISLQVMGEQKFRPAFGPVNWRMLQDKNKVKILFIGQDATHIAEAAGRTATAGFGGRAQDLAAYFGVNEGAAFINTFSYTIKGQYGAFQTPYVLRNESGDSLHFGNYVDNELWLLSQDLASPMVKWRNKLIDWIIRNNQDSLQLIVTFGGAARDSIATYIESKGGKVGATHTKRIRNIQIPETDLVYAGGNNEFPILVDEKGKDLYTVMMGRKVDYSKLTEQEAVKKDITDNFESYKSKMIFTKGGPLKNGLLNPAQLDGFDLAQIEINNKKTRSLKGIKLNGGEIMNNDLLVVELPHPTFLSNLSATEASEHVAKNLRALSPYVEKGWKIKADEGMKNRFAEGEPYRYARKDIGPEYYDFGAPGTRMVPVSSASRMGGNPHVIVFGTRERANFDQKAVEELTTAIPAQGFLTNELYITRPRSPELRYNFDAGPGEKYARIMKENLNLKDIFTVKPGTSVESDGIDAFVVKSSPENSDFGHYRGTFLRPQVLIVADPHGYDDLITARALTGTRGQYIQGMMTDLGVGEKYLVIKTVPFGMDKASKEDWQEALNRTRAYREKVLNEIFKDSTPSLIIADGVYAQKEAERILKSSGVKIVKLDRTGNHSKDILNVSRELGVSLSGRMSNIPRSHLSFYARIWEGTSGDRVLNATDKYRGFAFAEVAPAWAINQKLELIGEESEEAKLLIDKLEKNGLPLPGEKVPHYLKRVEIDPYLTIMREMLKIFKAA